MSALLPIATSCFLSSLYKNRSLPKHTFYFIASVVLSVINRPEEIPRIWEYAVDNVAIPGSSSGAYVESELRETRATSCENDGRESALKIHRKIREAILKSSPICGLPKVFISLRTIYPHDVRNNRFVFHPGNQRPQPTKVRNPTIYSRRPVLHWPTLANPTRKSFPGPIPGRCILR